MWGQKEQQEHSEHGLYLLTHIHQTLQDLIKATKGDDREAQREIITLTDAAFPYAANGYRYNGLYVAGGETITVEYRGFSYSQVLQAGWNQLNLPDGCLVSTAGNSFMAEIVRDQMQYLSNTADVALSTNSSLFPLFASITGSSATLPVQIDGPLAQDGSSAAVMNKGITVNSTIASIAAGATYNGPTQDFGGMSQVYAAANANTSTSPDYALGFVWLLGNVYIGTVGGNDTTASSSVSSAAQELAWSTTVKSSSGYIFITNASTTEALTNINYGYFARPGGV